MEHESAGDSSEQREAEPVVLEALSTRLRVRLVPKRVSLPDGAWCEIFGFSEEPPILAEVCVHQGPLKGGQKRKLMADVFKMLFVEKTLRRECRKVMVLADTEAAAFFSTRAWIPQAFTALGIEAWFSSSQRHSGP
jgi:hypothetical protein